jgi:hypothetical protein
LRRRMAGIFEAERGPTAVQNGLDAAASGQAFVDTGLTVSATD